MEENNEYTEVLEGSLVIYPPQEYKTSISDKNIILTTEKDKVKLLKYKEHFEGIKLYFSPIKINIDNSEEFNNQITNYVTEHKRKC